MRFVLPTSWNIERYLCEAVARIDVKRAIGVQTAR